MEEFQISQGDVLHISQMGIEHIFYHSNCITIRAPKEIMKDFYNKMSQFGACNCDNSLKNSNNIQG